MVRNEAMPVLVGVFVVLAGCSTGGVTTAPQTPTPTTTTSSPATTTTHPVSATQMPNHTQTTETTTSTERPTLPPGVTDAGVEESTLLDAHASVLAETAYTARLRTTIQTTESDVPATSVRVGRWNPTTERGMVEFVTDSITKTAYSNASETFTKRTVAGNTSYSTRATTLSQRHLTSLSTLQRYVEAADFAHEGVVTRNGTQSHRLTASSVAAKQDLREQLQATSIEAFDATLLVAPSGVIQRAAFTVEYTAMQTNETLTTTVEYRVSNLSATVVSKPAWVETADQYSTVVNVAATNTSLAVVVDEGRLPAGSELFVYVAGQGQATVRLNQTVSAGETVYAYFENGRLHVARSRPGDAERITGSYSVAGVRPNGLTVFQTSGYIDPPEEAGGA